MGVESLITPGGPRLLVQRNLEKAVLDANGIEVPRPEVEPVSVYVSVESSF